MEEIIDDVPPSYRLLEDLAEYQIDYLISILAGEWKTYAQWLWQNWDFDTLSEFCHRIRDQHGEMHGEAMDEEAQEDAYNLDTDTDESVIEISSDEESQVDDEGPPVESDDDLRESWIWKPKD